MDSKKAISIECIMACIYFVCLPFTVVTTPAGSLLKVVTMPIILVLSVRLMMGKSDLTVNYIHVFYILYVLYTISTLFVFYNDLSFTTVKDMVLGLLMLLLISVRIYNDREREWMETAWLIEGLFCIYICLTSTEVVSDAESRTVIRVLGYEEDQNQFCAYLIMPAIISVKRFIDRRRFYPLYAAILVLLFYAVLKTGSRGGLIGIAAGVSVYVMIGIKSVKTRALAVIGSVFAVFIFIAVVMPLLPGDVAERYSVSSVVESGGTGRFDIWRFLLSYSFQNPARFIRGSGIFSTYDIMHAEGFGNGVAHNAYIQIINDEGLIGMLLFLAVIISCLLRNYKKAPVYACAFTALLAFSMSLTFYVFKPYINIMMMCAMSFEGELPEDRIKLKRRTE